MARRTREQIMKDFAKKYKVNVYWDPDWECYEIYVPSKKTRIPFHDLTSMKTWIYAYRIVQTTLDLPNL